jgi:ribosomal-protein-alanine N-acetyltransferase
MPFPLPIRGKTLNGLSTWQPGLTTNLFLAIDVSGEAVGGIGIHLLDDVKRRSAEIGYWISESLWGRGIVTDAVRSLVPVTFKRYDIVRLQAGIFSNNPASMRVLEKCGFTREAVHRNAIVKMGVILDEMMYVHFRAMGNSW